MLAGHQINSFLEISSAQNPRIKFLKKLWDRKDREREQKFLIEGFRELQRAFLSVEFDSLFICPELFLGSNEEALIKDFISKKIPIFRCTESLFRSISYRDRPDGLIAIGFQHHLGLKEFETKLTTKNPFIVVAESIEKPGNLGTILRSSDAVKADGLIVCDRCTDIHNPNVVRASVGTLFTVPVVECSKNELINWLQERKIAMIAATPSAQMEFTQADLRGPIAILLGTEQYGLSKEFMEQATLKVRIPMLGVADSLNVAMAATLLLYETLRQRSYG